MCALLAAAVLAGAPGAGGAAARQRKKSSLTATINGKRFKPTGKVPLVAAYDPGTDLLVIGGTSTKIRPRRGTVRILAISCIVDLDAGVFPAPCTATTAQYSDNTYTGRIPGTPTAWAGEGIGMTIDSYDGTRVRGTFSGSLPPGIGGATGPATFSDGRFSLVLG